MDVFKNFQQPGTIYRGKPFWAWNGKLDEAELIRQIHVMKEMGFGGFFMHSRTGLETEYLGEEWFEFINTCADEAEKLGMEAWLYDEDRWPSGTAGGMVTKHPEYRLKFIRLTICSGSQFTWENDTLAAFRCRLSGHAFRDVRRIDSTTPKEQYETDDVLQFRIEEMTSSSTYNGFTYVDTMKREATEYFLEQTHEKYRAYCGDRLGRSIKGIFVDEPHRGALMDGFSLDNNEPHYLAPWTEALFDRFEQTFGYDLVDRLPELFLQADGVRVSQVKWHYTEMVQRLFLENFAQPMDEWCRKHNLILTGHILHEDSLTAQTAVSGSMMRYYPHMEYPGVDVLTEGNRNYWIVKQLSSVARQLDQKWLLSELYGCTGWQMDFESHKAVGDWQALFGINLRCHHLSWYTMKGEAKRDYPASILHQSSWWKDYNYVESYFSRLGVIMSTGKAQCDVLVLHPVESVWCQVYPGWSRSLQAHSPEVQQLENQFSQLFHWLCGAQIDFDYGDEALLEQWYRIEQVGNEAVLHVGKATYQTVVIGGLTTIRSSTLHMLRAFIEAGGNVIFVGDEPGYVDAIPSQDAQEVAQDATHIEWEHEQFVKTMRTYTRPLVRVTDAYTGQPITDIFCQVRESDGQSFIVLMNVNRETAYKHVRITLEESGTVEEWNCQTGERWRITPVQENESASGGKMEWVTSFPAVGEHVYVLNHAHASSAPAAAPLVDKTVSRLTDSYAYTLQEPNVCVLDMAHYRINDGSWQPKTEILKVDRAVRDHFRLPYRSGEMIQPWYRQNDAVDVKGDVHLRFEFDLDVIPDDSMQLVVEDPHIWSIACNDHPVDSSGTTDWWIDVSMRRLTIPRSHLRLGKNTITMSVAFHEQVNVEAVYLLGQFAVHVEGTHPVIGKLPSRLEAGDLVQQGLPFYSGTVSYEIPLDDCPKLHSNERVYVSIPDFEAACLKVYRSEYDDPEYIAWEPFEADITELVRNNAPSVRVDAVLTRRNTFGPLHLKPKYADAYGPGHFVTEGAHFSDEYEWIPSGILSTPQIHVRQIVEENEIS